MNDCLNDDTLRQLLADTLAGDVAESAHAHVDGCARCQQELERLTDDRELQAWSRQGAEGGNEVDPQTDAALRQLMQSMESLCPARLLAPATSSLAGESWRRWLAPCAGDQGVGMLGPYRVEAELGRGAMGIVLRAQDTELSRTVAVKLLRPELLDSAGTDLGARDRFVREAQLVAQLHHDNIVGIHAVVNEAGAPPYLVMEYVAGPTLGEAIHQVKRLAPRQAAEICAQVADGLHAAHAAGLVHRDIKPSNILLDRDSGRAKLVDFGLARALATAAGMTAHGQLVGTPAYMSPEQVRHSGRVDARSDVYSLGATLYEMITGQPPFAGTVHMVLQQVLGDEPRRPRLFDDTIPMPLETICLKAMAKEPAGRYASAHDLAADLGRWIRDEPILARPAGPIERLRLWRRRNPRVALLSGLIALLLLAISGGSIWFALRLNEEQTETLIALDKAQENASAARAAEQVAEDNAKEARELGAAALDAHSALVFKVQEQLDNKPGTLQLRRELLETALAGLERMIKKGENAPHADRSIVAAHGRVGDVLLALGRSNEAWQRFEKARDWAERRAAERPGDTQAQRDLTLAYNRLGAFRYQEQNLAAALGYFTKAHAISEAIVKGSDDADVRRDLAIACNKLADVHRYLNAPKEAEACYLQGLGITQALADAHPENTTYKRDLRFSYARLAMMYEAQLDLKRASLCQQKALERARELAGLNPQNTQWQRDLGFTAALAGTLDLKLDRVDVAVDRFNTYLRIAEKLNQDDPANVVWLRDIALASLRLAEAHLRGHDLAAARRSAQRSLDVTDRLLKKDAGSVPLRIDRAVICTRLADLAEREGNYADTEQWYAQDLQTLRQLEKEGKLQGGILRSMRAQADLCQRALKLAPSVVASQEPIAAGDTQAVLVALRALALARQGRHVAAAACAEQLRAGAATPGTYFAAIARVHSLCAAGLSSSRGGKPAPDEASALRLRYRDSAMIALAQALRQSPTYEVHLEPDFDVLRSEARYQQLVHGSN